MIDIGHGIPCFICKKPLDLRLARGRKSGKPFLMLICASDARHFRGFITQQDYVSEVLVLLESQTIQLDGDEDIGSAPRTRSKTNLEPGNER